MANFSNPSKNIEKYLTIDSIYLKRIRDKKNNLSVKKKKKSTERMSQPIKDLSVEHKH